MRYPLPFFLTCIFIVTFQQSFAQCPAPITVSIDNITTTESRCNTSGTAVVEISNGAAPFTYSIVAGPVLASPQSSNIFQALSQGNYTAQVTDNCNQSITKNFTITGSYNVPEVSNDLQFPTCPGASNGQITINITNGRAPFTYSLISPSPITAGPQSSNVFSGLSAGTYTYQVADSCNNFQTRTVTLPDGERQNIYISNNTFRWKACDSFAVSYAIANYNFTPLHFPITVNFSVANSIFQTHTLLEDVENNFIQDSFFFKYKHIKGNNEPVVITATDACGNTYTFSSNLGSTYLDMWAYGEPIPGCTRQLRYRFDDLKDNLNPLSAFTPHCSNITYTLVSPVGITLLTQTNNSIFTGFPPGTGYKIVREDCCGKDTLVFEWKEVPALNPIYDVSPQYSCKENTTGLKWFADINTFISPLTFIIVSGPPSVTFLDGTVKNYSYPDTVTKKDPRGAGIINYLVTGTYTFEISDTCGQKKQFVVEIKPSDLRHSSVSTKVTRGCIDDNKIRYTAASNTGAFWATGGPAYIDFDEISNSSKVINENNYTDSVINLAPGIYHLNYRYNNPWVNTSVPLLYAKGMDGMSCDIKTYAVTIPDYTQPIFTTPLAIAVCGVNRNVALLPDSSRGVLPYTYQITAGSITTAIQNSPVFPNLSKGVYTFRMADFCGNSYSSSIAIDTLIFPDIATIGDPCKGGSVIFKAPSSPYYFYVWEKPDGTFSTKDSISINPIADIDTGYYKLTITSLINGCSDSKTRTLHFNYCLPVPLKLVSFNGFIKDNNAILSWQTANEINAAYFYVENSIDGIHFSNIQKIIAANGATNYYTYADRHIANTGKYYRLAQYDKDNKVTYSGILHLSFAVKESISVGPNPAKSTLNIQWYSKRNATGSLSITDLSGKLVINRASSLVKGNNLISIPLHSMAKGIYIVTLKNNDIVKSIPFTKE